MTEVINCPACGHQIIIDGEPGEKCYFCHHVIEKKPFIINKVGTKPVPRKGRMTTTGEKTKQTGDGMLPAVPPRPNYRANLELIGRYLDKLGPSETVKAWGMKINTLYRLFPERAVKKHYIYEPASQAGRKTEEVFKLPPFPAFNEAWPYEVCVAWLQAYAQMAAKC